MLEDGRRKAEERDGSQKEEMAGSRRAKERVAKAGRREKAKVYGLSMRSWASGTSNSSSRHKKEHSIGRKMHGEAMSLGGNRALDP
jgi:hypothetical protein